VDKWETYENGDQDGGFDEDGTAGATAADLPTARAGADRVGAGRLRQVQEGSWFNDGALGLRRRPSRPGRPPSSAGWRGAELEILTATREQLDLRDQAAVTYWFKANRPEYIYLAAGTVGGIFANSTRPAEFIYDNMLIHATVVHAAHQYGAKKLLYLGSSCIYPRDSPQPMTEAALLTGALEPSNESYAIAKIAGIKLCQAYRRQYGSNFIRRCRPTSTARTTTSICRTHTSCRR
jgi:hypothetical protein